MWLGGGGTYIHKSGVVLLNVHEQLNSGNLFGEGTMRSINIFPAGSSLQNFHVAF